MSDFQDFLSIPEKDKIIHALRDVGQLLYDDPRRYTYDELDEVLTVLWSKGYKLVPIKPAKVTPPAAPAPVAAATPPAAPTAPAATTLSAGERYQIESVYLPGLKAMAHKEGFVYKLHQMRFVLTLLCRTNNIPIPT